MFFFAKLKFMGKEQDEISTADDIANFIATLRGIADTCEMSLLFMKKHGISSVESGNWKTAKRGIPYVRNFSESLATAVTKERQLLSINQKVDEEEANLKLPKQPDLPKPIKRKKAANE